MIAKVPLPEVLKEFVEFDVRRIHDATSGSLGRKQIKKLRKKLLKRQRERVKIDPLFKSLVLDICKLGWGGANRKRLLFRNFEGVV